ncbi:MAG: sigma-70 family RNA polymerase sigma factor [Solirubrobacteraceae bacterium]
MTRRLHDGRAARAATGGARHTGHEAALFARAAQGDARARDALVERFIPLTRSVALRYAGTAEPLEDLFQVAALALVKAVDRFDPQRGHAFTSYAVPTIVGELRRHFRDRTWAVRPPRDLQELVLRVVRARDRCAHRLARAPTIGELSEASGECEERVLEALQAHGARDTLSLQGPTATRQALQETLGVHERGFEHAENRAYVDGLLARLPRQEREILRMRFVEDMVQAEIAARIGRSQMQVSRAIRSALDTLRDIADQH